MLNIVLASVAGTAVSRLMFAQSPASPHITGDWLVDIRTVIAVGFVVVGGSWNVGRFIKGVQVELRLISERLSTGERRFDDLEKRMNHRDERLDRIERILDKLPRGDTEIFKRKSP